LYLSAIRDLFDNFIVAYKTARRQDYKLVGETIQAALESEKPTIPLFRLCQHRESPETMRVQKTFFSIFKTECIRLEKPKTPEEADILTNEFLDYYNCQRQQLRSGLSPYDERRRWYGNNKIS